jgi:AraC-like DNA-binding protein
MTHSPTGHADPSLLTSTLWFQYVKEAIARTGLDSDALAAEVGLDNSILNDPKSAVSDEYIHRLMILASERSGNPQYGLHAAAHVKLSAFGPLGYAMMSSSDLHSALLKATRLSGSLTQAVSARLVYAEGTARLEIQTRPFTDAVSRHPQEFTLLSFLNLLRWMTGKPLIPLHVALMPKAPKSNALYLEHFGIIPEFNAPMASLTFSEAQLALPLVGADPELAVLHDRQAIAHSLEMGKPLLSQLARRAIMVRLPEGEPSLTEIAASLHLGERTVQRRLEEEGRSFHELVDDVRRDLLEMHLVNPDISLKQIASLLGFSNQSSLTRTTHRLFNASPRDLRKRLLNG